MEKTLNKTVSINIFILTLSLILISSITLSFLKSSHLHLPLPSIPRSSDKSCDVFKGKWVPYPQGPPYYSNETCRMIIDQQNCMKFGRPDTEFMKWRWKPDECQLPLFDAAQFLEIVKGKSMAFVGDSVGRNQMESLLCLLAHEADPEDITQNKSAEKNYFQRWFYADYNFTLAAFWSPFLVKSELQTSMVSSTFTSMKPTKHGQTRSRNSTM
ncbi:Protein trichome birefringence-like 19 [Hibiscus syriacus]|uniref:Protein trichome birefringence-like 19 n=1 Tax=Hibiscus syriacus TaxID=106335 RepID=A0A6A3D5L8_HIBSY|nr:Protein trichome birefringence-like 19 [Hibiscus syriacus]